MGEVCVDASFALKMVLPESNRDEVRAVWASWLSDGTEIVAPWLLLFEAHSVLRRKVSRNEVSEEEARQAWRLLRRQGIRTAHPRGLFDRAWALAAELNRPTTYDAVYLAVAELRGCDFWTADVRLANTAKKKFSWVRSVVA